MESVLRGRIKELEKDGGWGKKKERKKWKVPSMAKLKYLNKKLRETENHGTEILATLCDSIKETEKL